MSKVVKKKKKKEGTVVVDVVIFDDGSSDNTTTVSIKGEEDVITVTSFGRCTNPYDPCP